MSRSTALRLSLFLILLGFGAIRVPANPLSLAAFEDGALVLDDGWLSRPDGAPMAAISPSDEDDTSWRRLDDTAGDAGEQLPEWSGIGWFRLDLDVAPDLVGQPLTIALDHSGASELFIDGTLIATAGRLAETAADTVPRNPRSTPTTVVFDRPGRHRLTLRYACHAAAHPLVGRWLTHRRGGGFRLTVDRADRALAGSMREPIGRLALNLGVSCFALGFAMFHGLLFLFHRGQRGNLWFALFALALAANGGLEILRDWLPVGLWGAHLIRLLNGPVAFGLVLSVIGFLDTVVPGPTPRPVRWLRWAAGPALLSYLLAGLLPVSSLFDLWALASVPITLLLVATAWKRRIHGSRALFISGVGWVLTIGGELGKAHFGLAFELTSFALGLIGMLVGVSLFLAYRIADESREMERLARHLEDRVQERTADLRRSERAARAANRAKSSFLATMSHEIRTPMNAIVGFAQLLSRADLPPREHDMVSTLERSASSLLKLIGDILDLSRVEAGRLELDDQAVWIETWIHDVVDLFAVQAREQGIPLTPTIDPSLPSVVLGDRLRLRQILVNLVGNALKFTPEGQVDVVAEARGDHLAVVVRDTGIGIPADRRQQVFQPFVQADGSSARRHGGAGLGLAICHELTAAMGGILAVAETPGGGATFTLLLPLREASPADVEMASSSETLSVDIRRPLRILLAEDNLINQQVIAMMIEDLGHDLDMVDCGEATFDALDDDDYDLLLLDLHMPDLDGVEVARRLRSAGHSLPIVALTASVLPEDRARCQAVGMDDFLSKPVRLETLQSIFARVAARSDP